ncbi:hypothetical protein BGX29_007937 [Mortierella sp. GBA35]|nr:hypothetical protein BGX29_007937 [Mortierella sp. GBA35]
MKFTIIATAVLAFIVSCSTTVSAQSDASACTLCLQQALQTLPACANVEATAGSVSPAYAACLCSSLDGSWIDSCSGADQCGAAIATFKASYGSNIQSAGLQCGPNGQAFFTPAATA